MSFIKNVPKESEIGEGDANAAGTEGGSTKRRSKSHHARKNVTKKRK